MFFFRKKRLLEHEQKKEAQIQAIRRDTFIRIDRAGRSMDKLADLLDDPDLGVTGKIFLATGGSYRKGKRNGSR